MQKTIVRKPVSILLSLLFVFSLMGMSGLSAAAEDCEHLYGTTNEARYTCVKCGEVNEALKQELSFCGSYDFREDFETDPAAKGWVFAGTDGNALEWEWYPADPAAAHPGLCSHSGERCISSASSDNGEAVAVDNYAFSPAFTVSPGATLSFWVAARSSEKSAEHFAVYFYKDSLLKDLTYETVAGPEYKNYTCDLSAFEGQEGQLVFRHYNTENQDRLLLDDIEVFSRKADAHDYEPSWSWAEDCSACTATLTCKNCGQTYDFAADVTEADGVYTASVTYAGVTYTDKSRIVNLTFDMGGKCENFVYKARVGASMLMPIVKALQAAKAQGYLVAGFLPQPEESYATKQEIIDAFVALSKTKVPETDTVIYTRWNTCVTPGFTVDAVKCGTDLAAVAPTVICDEPSQYYAQEAIWTDEEPGIAVGGTACQMFLCLSSDFGYAFYVDKQPAISGAEPEEVSLNGTQHYFFLNVTPQHFTDATSKVTETVLTAPTATAAGEKEVCVYCAGGCGEVVDRHTETIPATGEVTPRQPSGNGSCKWCGEHHSGFWGSIVGFWHTIFYFWAHLFGKR